MNWWTVDFWTINSRTAAKPKKKHPSNLGTAWIEMHRQLIVDQSLTDRKSPGHQSSKGAKTHPKTPKRRNQWVSFAPWKLAPLCLLPKPNKPKKCRFPIPSISRCDDKHVNFREGQHTSTPFKHAVVFSFFVGVRGRQPNESELPGIIRVGKTYCRSHPSLLGVIPEPLPSPLHNKPRRHMGNMTPSTVHLFLILLKTWFSKFFSIILKLSNRNTKIEPMSLSLQVFESTAI